MIILKDFNSEYDANLSMERLDAIMAVDYSDGEAVKRMIKERGKN